jgi:hypothetical protein
MDDKHKPVRTPPTRLLVYGPALPAGATNFRVVRMPLQNHPKTRRFIEAGPLSQMSAWYESERNVMWMMLHAHPRPCFNPELLKDISNLVRAAKESRVPIDFWVTGSTVPGLYNVGGDLSYFAQHIRVARSYRFLGHGIDSSRAV